MDSLGCALIVQMSLYSLVFKLMQTRYTFKTTTASSKLTWNLANWNRQFPQTQLLAQRLRYLFENYIYLLVHNYTHTHTQFDHLPPIYPLVPFLSYGSSFSSQLEPTKLHVHLFCCWLFVFLSFGDLVFLCFFSICIGGNYLIYSSKGNFPVARELKNRTPHPQQSLTACNSSRCGEALEAIPNPQGSTDGPRQRHLYCYSWH